MTTRAQQQSPAPSFSTTYSASTNRRTGDTADSNGNITYVNSQYLSYDIENRISGVGTYSGDTSVAQYGYDAGNKRVWRGGAGPSGSLDELTFWAPNGQKLGTYEITYDSNYLNYYLKLKQTWVYFGGKLVSKGALYTGSGSGSDKVALSSVVQDRLGSQNGKFYPYGIERPSASANDTEKFATYTRDSTTGLDYAVNRYEQPGYGRFITTDPRADSARPSDPASWSRYSYAGGDPANRTDSNGLDYCWDNMNAYDGGSGCMGGGGGGMWGVPGGGGCYADFGCGEGQSGFVGLEPNTATPMTSGNSIIESEELAFGESVANAMVEWYIGGNPGAVAPAIGICVALPGCGEVVLAGGAAIVVGGGAVYGSYRLGIWLGNVFFSKASQKERATDTPNWARYYKKEPEEKCSEFAERIVNAQFGVGSKQAQRRGPGSPYQQIKKACERGGL